MNNSHEIINHPSMIFPLKPLPCPVRFSCRWRSGRVAKDKIELLEAVEWNRLRRTLSVQGDDVRFRRDAAPERQETHPNPARNEHMTLGY
jgi:hypothetical protein